METLIGILVFAAIALINWLVEKSAEVREQRKTQERLDRLERSTNPETVRPDPRVRPADPEEQMREFLEALGLPTESEPPPPITPRNSPPPLPEPRQVEAPPPTFLEAVAESLEKPLVIEPRSVPVQLNPKPVEKKRKRRKEAAAVEAASHLETLLRSEEGLRSAMVAREILGPPKGLVF